MPAVTVFASESGDPMANTGSPTASASESPNATGRSPSFMTLITAMSDSGSWPTMVAGLELPSLKTTEACPVAPATT